MYKSKPRHEWLAKGIIDDAFYSVAEACEILNCARSTLNERVRLGLIDAYKDGRMTRIPGASIRAYRDTLSRA